MDVVRDVDLDDEEAVKASRRPVLREILLCEFGASFREHPEFLPMLDSIEQALEADETMPRRFVDLLRALRK
jgi:hypothetical protein